MKLSGDKLPASLSRGLAAAYLVSGDETLLVGEACDAIRTAARAAGHLERELYVIDRTFDWRALEASSRTLSLFAERRIVELRLSGASPGNEPAPSILAELVANGGPDTLLLVVAARLDARALSSGWVSAFDQHGVIVQIWPVEPHRLPDWVRARLARRGLEIDADAASVLAERVEGNLLAAHQEVEKLALTHSGGRLDLKTVVAAVADSARFDVLQLGEAAMRGEAQRALRILEGLRGEGRDATLVLWALNKDLQWLVRVADRVRGGQSVDAAMAQERVWRPRQTALRTALTRLPGGILDELIEQAARTDRAIKGVIRLDPWNELAALTARLAGVPLARTA